MLCLVSSGPAPHLDDQALGTARLVAQVLDDLHHRSLGEAAARDRAASLRAQVEAVCAGVGRRTVFQPIVELTSGALVAAEALTRFDDTGRNPAGWFAAAHASGLGQQLELVSARDALEVLTPGSGPPAVCVNLSPDVVTSVLAEALDGVDVSRVVLELTEHAPVRDYDALQEAMRPFRDAGLRLAVDDAGAGYASMSHVLKLRPDVLKIDMSLVRSLDADPIRRALVGALVRFACETKTQVIAEGVETGEEISALVDVGVRFGQGYRLGMPGPASAISGRSPEISG
jgi:EAL domain-containing protein (putative c-di-GMP-specific phosphodiesterase class I)